jgi:Fic-DOC domain mobile mystery protein B
VGGLTVRGWEPIPGETPLDNLSGFRHLKLHPSPTRDIVNQLEAENIRKATVKYLSRRPSARTAPFTHPWLFRLHRDMFSDVWDWAGTQRRTATNIGVPPLQITEALQSMLVYLNHWKAQGDPPVRQAALLHHTAVKIHPFVNGNGRWSRMLANIWLKQQGQPVTAWPAAIETRTQNREEYLAAVRLADGLDYEPLIALHERYAQGG